MGLSRLYCDLRMPILNLDFGDLPSCWSSIVYVSIKIICPLLFLDASRTVVQSAGGIRYVLGCARCESENRVKARLLSSILRLVVAVCCEWKRLWCSWRCLRGIASSLKSSWIGR
jgi:hypothetical protein